MCIRKYVSVTLRNVQCVMLEYRGVTFVSLGIWNVIHQVHAEDRDSDSERAAYSDCTVLLGCE